MASPKFTYTIKEIAIDVKDVVYLPSLDWKLFCRNLLDERVYIHYQNLLIFSNKYLICHNCFSYILIDQTKPQFFFKCIEINLILNKKMRYSPFL